MRRNHAIQYHFLSNKYLILKNVLMFALLFTSVSAFAFGGGGGGRTRRFYDRHAGVDAIGIHRHTDKDEQADIKFSCDDPNASPNMQGVCECNEGYEMQEGVCVIPTPQPITCNPCEDLVEEQCVPRTCGDNMHCDTEQDQCVCDEGYEPDGQGGCKESCPEERQCGETCCGEGNICVGGNQCCNKYAYEEYQDDSQCCPASESTGFDSYGWTCCSLEQTTYTTDEYGTTQCCSGSVYENAGYNNSTLCCDHEPETYKDFKVCWTPETTCKTNADCGAGEFCNLKNETDWSCYYPTSGTCEQITTDDYTDANVEGVGNVRGSTYTMTWWAADQWCKAQGKSLIDISKFNCYYNGTNNPISTDNGGGYCCKGNNQSCGAWNSYWNGNTIQSSIETTVNNKYSPEFVNLRKAFGGNCFWTASDYSSTDSCYAFVVNFNGGEVFNNSRYDHPYALCE